MIIAPLYNFTPHPGGVTSGWELILLIINGALVAPGGEPQERHLCQSGSPKFSRRIVSMVFGGYVWHTCCLGCDTHWLGVAETKIEARAAGHAMLPHTDKTEVVEHLSSLTKKVIVDRGGWTVPLTMQRLLDFNPQLQMPGRERVIAVDGGYNRITGRAGWAMATGAGWTATEVLEPGMWGESSCGIAELAAIMRAAFLFPQGVPITILSDGRDAVEYLNRVMRRGIYPKPQWVPPLARTQLGKFRGRAAEAAITVKWIPEQSDPLHQAAHRLAYRTARSEPEVRKSEGTVEAMLIAFQTNLKNLQQALSSPAITPGVRRRIWSEVRDQVERSSLRVLGPRG